MTKRRRKQRRAKRQAQKQEKRQAEVEEHLAQVRKRRRIATTFAGAGIVTLAALVSGIGYSLSHLSNKSHVNAPAKTLPPVESTIPRTDAAQNLPESTYITPQIDIETDTLIAVKPATNIPRQVVSQTQQFFSNHYQKTIPGFERIIEFSPRQIDTRIGFAPNNQQVQAYIKRQTYLTERIKEYFNLTEEIEIFAAQRREDLRASTDKFYAPIVGKRASRLIFQSLIRVNGRSITPAEASVKWLDDVGDIHFEWDVNLDQGRITGITRDTQETIIPAHHCAGVTVPIEYVHFATLPVVEYTFLSRARGQPYDHANPPSLESELIENEGVVHACVLSALQDMNLIDQSRADTILYQGSGAPQYARVPHYYRRARSEGTLKVFNEYCGTIVQRQ